MDIKELFDGIDDFEIDEVEEEQPQLSEHETRRVKINDLYDQKAKIYNDKLDADMSDIPVEHRETIKAKMLDGAIAVEKERMDAIGKIDANITKDKQTQEQMEAQEGKPQGVDIGIEKVKLGFLGARRLTQGLAKVVTDVAGIESEKLEADIAEREDYIADRLDALGYDKDAVFTPDMIGQLAAEFAVPVAKIKGAFKLAGIGAGAAATGEVGKGEDYGTAGTVGATTFALGAIGGKIANKLFPDTGKVPTDFAKRIKELGTDESKALNEVLDNLDDKAIEVMDEGARDKLLSDVLENFKTTKDVGEDVLASLGKSKEQAREVVKEAYGIADEIGKRSKTAVARNALGKAEEAMKDSPRLYKDTFDDIKSIVGRGEQNAFQIESSLSELKRLQRSADGKEKNLYGLAIEGLEDLQQQIGGGAIYENARKFSEGYNRHYTKVIKEGEHATAGSKVAEAIKDKTKFNIGKELFNKDIDPNLIGTAVRQLPNEDKMALATDALMRGVLKEKANTPAGVSKILQNYNAMNPEGLQELVGKSAAKKLRRELDSLAVVEVAIKEANKFDATLGKELLDIGVSASMFKLSPFLAIRSSAMGIKRMMKKFVGGKQQLVARVKKVKNPVLKNKMLKAISLSTAGLTAEKLSRMAKEAPRETVETKTEDKPTHTMEETLEQGFTVEELEEFESTLKEEKPKQSVKWGRGVVDEEGKGIYSKVRPSSSVANNEYGTSTKDTTYNKLVEREGKKDTVYKDSRGLKTAGIGHLLTDAEKKKYPLGSKIPEAQIKRWYEQDTKKAKNAARLQAKELNEPKLEEALVHVNFQLGTQWKKKFHETYPLLKAKKYSQAIRNLKSSAWMKQTPKRVNDFIDEIKKVM